MCFFPGNLPARLGLIALLLAPLLAPVAAWSGTTPVPPTGAPAGAAASAETVTLSDSQLRSITVARVGEHDFPLECQAVGNVDFNQNRNVLVFTPYPGRIIEAFADLGDEVKKGQVLFTIESPDFIAAQSSLISAAATFEQTTSALARAHALYVSKGIDQNDYEIAVANQHSAEGALHAARRDLEVFGKTAAEIEHIETSRTVETALVVRSPISGRVTARIAAPGLYELPGTLPAPFTVADLSTMWLVAQVVESDSPRFKVGQAMSVSVAAYPGRAFAGKITAVGALIDPNTRRLMLRSEIKDPKHELIADMFANFVITVGPPEHGTAVPVNSVVREGDGTLSVWVVGSDPHRFTRRIVKVGLTHDGYDEIKEGLHTGETVAVDGAILLSNILFGGAS